MPQIPIFLTKINDAVMFAPPGLKEDVFVVSLVDPSKQLFMSIKASDKSPYQFKSTDMVTKIDVPGIGQILLALK